MRHRHDPIEIAICLAIFGGGLLYSSWKRFKRSIQVKNTPRAMIATAAQGQAELEGYAWPSISYPSPLSGDSSVFFNLTLEEYRLNNGRYNGIARWIELAYYETPQTFFIIDRSGLALVDPTNAEFEIKQTQKSWKFLSETQKAACTDCILSVYPSFSPETMLGFRFLRVTERSLKVGSPLYLLGTFVSTSIEPTHAPKPAPGVLDFLSDIKKHHDPNQASITENLAQHMITRGAHPVVAKSKTSVQQTMLDLHSKEACIGLVTSTANDKLYVADCHKKDLLGRIDRWNGIRVIGGAVLMAGAAIIAFLRFNGTIK